VSLFTCHAVALSGVGHDPTKFCPAIAQNPSNRDQRGIIGLQPAAVAVTVDFD
jgi:hypothetical protein